MRKTAGPLFETARRNENKKFAEFDREGAEAGQAERPGETEQAGNSDDEDKSGGCASRMTGTSRSRPVSRDGKRFGKKIRKRIRKAGEGKKALETIPQTGQPVAGKQESDEEVRGRKRRIADGRKVRDSR